MAARSGTPAKSFLVRVQPAVLQWTRNTANLRIDEIARKIKVEPDEVQAWEDSTGAPTYAQLELLAKHYRRPIAVFYLPEPPQGYKVPKGDFRHLPGGGGALSPALSVELRRVHMQREVALWLAELSDESPPQVDLEVVVSDIPAEAARRIRVWLGVTLADQLNWSGDEYKILNGWIAAVEAKGILVAQATGVSTREMRGFAISERPFPVVVLNSADAPRAKVFTLLHEVVHVLMNSGGLCDLHDDPVADRSLLDRIETFCNRVAAFVVLPAEVVRLDLGDGKWSDSALWRLSKRYGLSAEAVLRHLVTLGRAGLDEYFAWRRRHERQYADASAGKGGSYFPNHLARIGRRYASDVIDAYRRNLITSMDASDYLDMRIVNIPRLAEKIEVG